MSRPLSKVPAEFGDEPNFVFANRDAFKDMAADDVFPRWLRVTFAAYAHVQKNGHAPFRQKRLAWILGDHDGTSKPTSRQRVREAIDGAIDRGLLLPESRALCLVVPREVVGYGKGQVRNCGHTRNDKTVSSTSETTRFLQVVSDQKERPKRVVSRSDASLLSINATEGAS